VFSRTTFSRCVSNAAPWLLDSWRWLPVRMGSRACPEQTRPGVHKYTEHESAADDRAGERRVIERPARSRDVPASFAGPLHPEDRHCGGEERRRSARVDATCPARGRLAQTRPPCAAMTLLVLGGYPATPAGFSSARRSARSRSPRGTKAGPASTARARSATDGRQRGRRA
jgi:hypothetical protein